METTTKTFWLPEKASTFADLVDPAFNLYYWISVFFFALICGLILLFVFKYLRKRPTQMATQQMTHNTVLELTWTLVPLIIAMALFVVGMKGYLKMRIPPSNAMTVNVTGQKWKWTFSYPQGMITDTLVVPVHQPVKLLMTSSDVLHSFFVPAFRQKADVIPNRYHSMWFEATKTGVFPVMCTQYCGRDHSYMWTAVKVVSTSDYDKWLADASDPSKGKTPAQYGAELYAKRGCNACHSLDGSRIVGPSWKGMWQRQEHLVGGATITIDENYLRESMLEPTAKVVEGFQPVMPTYKGLLTDKDVAALIAFIQTLK